MGVIAMMCIIEFCVLLSRVVILPQMPLGTSRQFYYLVIYIDLSVIYYMVSYLLSTNVDQKVGYCDVMICRYRVCIFFCQKTLNQQKQFAGKRTKKKRLRRWQNDEVAGNAWQMSISYVNGVYYQTKRMCSNVHFQPFTITYGMISENPIYKHCCNFLTRSDLHTYIHNLLCYASPLSSSASFNSFSKVSASAVVLTLNSDDSNSPLLFGALS